MRTTRPIHHAPGSQSGRTPDRRPSPLPNGPVPSACYHGGAFFDAVGPRFDHLHRARDVINADVLDAWFDPAPNVLAALRDHLPWLLKTSPPTQCEGLIETIAETRSVPDASILTAGGSSDLIFLALRHWLNPGARVLILDPMYGEYAHILEHVIGCRVDRFQLQHARNYDIDVASFKKQLTRAYDLVILVNPNSPTGRYLPIEQLHSIINTAPADTRFWIDETYIEYVGNEHSLEHFAANSDNTFICKSMSKVYALSGARIGYLIGPPHRINELRPHNPPWAVSLPAQVAAVEALRNPVYYRQRHEATHSLRAVFAKYLRAAMPGIAITPGIANFLLCHLPPDGPTADKLVRACRAHKLFIRNAAAMGANLGDRAIRIAVKDHVTNQRMCRILKQCWALNMKCLS